MTPLGGMVRVVRRLRCIVGETLIEVGTIIRDLGGFVLPNYERHPAFSPNGEIDHHIQRPTPEALDAMRRAR